MTDQKSEQQQGADFAALGVPQDAIARLAELRPGHAGSIFTSDLSVNEFLLVREAGFRPLGLVLGTSIYHVGSADRPLGQEPGAGRAVPGHVPRPRAGHDPDGGGGLASSARTASSGSASTSEMKEFGNDIAEFIAVGTAVKADPGTAGGVKEWRNVKKQPFTSDLSGQDFWTLIRAGYAPLGMVMGSCVYHIAHQRLSGKIGNIGRNVELEQFTQALYDARELAMSRMQAEAEELKAEGIVGVQLRRALAHVGLTHHRVLRDRHRSAAAARRPRDRAAHDGAQPRLLRGQLSWPAMPGAGSGQPA